MSARKTNNDREDDLAYVRQIVANPDAMTDWEREEFRGDEGVAYPKRFMATAVHYSVKEGEIKILSTSKYGNVVDGRTRYSLGWGEAGVRSRHKYPLDACSRPFEGKPRSHEHIMWFDAKEAVIQKVFDWATNPDNDMASYWAIALFKTRASIPDHMIDTLRKMYRCSYLESWRATPEEWIEATQSDDANVRYVASLLIERHGLMGLLSDD